MIGIQEDAFRVYPHHVKWTDMELLRNQKGAHAEPPSLSTLLDQTAQHIRRWPGVEARAHWGAGSEGAADGVDFHLGERELGHVHLDGACHVSLTQAIASTVVERGLACAMPWRNYREWVVFHVRSDADRGRALWLFRLAYELRLGVGVDVLLRRATNDAVACLDL